MRCGYAAFFSAAGLAGAAAGLVSPPAGLDSLEVLELEEGAVESFLAASL